MTSEAFRASEEVKSAERAQQHKITRKHFLPKAIFNVIAAKFSVENHLLFWWVEMPSATHAGLEKHCESHKKSNQQNV